MTSGMYVAMRRPAEFFETDNLANATRFADQHGCGLFFILYEAEPPRKPPVEADEPAPVVAAEPAPMERKRSRSKSKKRS